MPDDVTQKVLEAMMDVMVHVTGSSDPELFRKEADALITYWASEHGRFGINGLVDAADWWQHQVTEDNQFPMTRRMQ